LAGGQYERGGGGLGLGGHAVAAAAATSVKASNEWILDWCSTSQHLALLHQGRARRTKGPPTPLLDARPPPPKTHGGEGEKFVRLALYSALFSVIQQYLD